MNDNRIIIAEIKSLLNKLECECCHQHADLIHLSYESGFCRDCYAWIFYDVVPYGKARKILRCVVARIAYLERLKASGDISIFNEVEEAA